MSSSFAKIGLQEKIGYGMGDAAFNFVWMTFIYFGMFYYTDVFGIAPETVGLLFLITRLWDVVNDPIMGMVADKTETKWGKFRPYLLFGALPLGIFATLCFTTPDLSENSKVIYAFITYFLVGMVYTAVNIPYSSMLGVITADRNERTGLSSARLIGAFTAGLIVQFFTQDLVKLFGQGDTQLGYQLTMGLYSFILVVLIMLCFSWTKERHRPPTEQQSDIGLGITIIILLFLAFILPFILIWKSGLSFGQLKASYKTAVCAYYPILISFLVAAYKVNRDKVPPDLRALMENVPFWVLFFVGIFTLSWVSIRGASMMYYFKYFLQNEDIAKYFMGFFTICNIAGAALTQWICKFWDKKVVYIALMLLNAVTIALVYFLPAENMVLFGILHFSNGLLAGPITVIVFSMYADIVDHTKAKTGQRIDGLIFSGASFSQKMGWTVGGAGAGFILAFFNYEANVDQTQESIEGIRLMFTFIPAALSVLAAMAMLGYQLTESKMTEVQAKIAAKEST